MLREIARGAFFGTLTVLIGCGGVTTVTSPQKTPSATGTLVAAVGRNEEEVRRSIDLAKRAGNVPRFVRIRTASNEHVFSPYAQVLRTRSVIVARAYGHMYVWNGSSAKVIWSAQSGAINEELPLVQAPDLDRAAVRLTGPLVDKMLVWSGPRPRKHADPWGAIKDPWQLHPDYAYVNPGPLGEASAAIAVDSRRASADMVCSFDNYGNSSCYYTSYGIYYPPFDGGPPPDGGGGGGPPPTNAPPKKGCADAAKTADNAVKEIIAKFQGIMSAAPTSTAPGNTAEGYTYIYQGLDGSFFYDTPKELNIVQSNGVRYEGTPNAPQAFPGYTVVGFVHTHPAPNAEEDSTGTDAVIGSPTYGTHFSPNDLNFAATFAGGPIAMYVAVRDTNSTGSNLWADRFYQLNYQQSGTDPKTGAPTYKATGETPPSNSTNNSVTASGC